jgi:hypothetical protein
LGVLAFLVAKYLGSVSGTGIICALGTPEPLPIARGKRLGMALAGDEVDHCCFPLVVFGCVPESHFGALSLA